MTVEVSEEELLTVLCGFLFSSHIIHPPFMLQLMSVAMVDPCKKILLGILDMEEVNNHSDWSKRN
jgi:hypothetical protein